jgi:beta-lactamase regulating signal transducer with metallopeptidase domain
MPDDAPAAFTLPGRPGQIVLSTGLLQQLEPEERRVVVAHERAHLQLRHHRYVRMTQMAAAVFPIVMPMVQRVRFATERWADEVAARSIGDRDLVARTVAHAALLQPAHGAGLGIASGSIVERVQALRRPAPTRSLWAELALTASVIATAALLVVSILGVQRWIVAFLGLCH